MTTSGNHDASSSGGARGGGHAERSSEQPHPPRTVRFVPDARGAPREPATAAVQGQPRAHQPHRQHHSDLGDVEVKEEVEEGSHEEAEEAGEEAEEAEERQRRERHAQAPDSRDEGRVEEDVGAARTWRTRLPPVRYAVDDQDTDADDYEEEEMEAEDEAEDEGEDEDEGSVDAVKRRYRTSQFKGVCWAKANGKWRAECKGKSLGYHATEEAAARAYNTYVKDGVVLVPPRDPACSSQFKGVRWDKGRGKWRVVCKGKHLGCHATEEAAARAYNIEAERIGRVHLNVIPPADD